jgi:hypothetical protein
METRIDVNDESSESTTSLKRYITASTRKEDTGTRMCGSTREVRCGGFKPL